MYNIKVVASIDEDIIVMCQYLLTKRCATRDEVKEILKDNVNIELEPINESKQTILNT